MVISSSSLLRTFKRRKAWADSSTGQYPYRQKYFCIGIHPEEEIDETGVGL
jgi:hypothetical protein